MAAVFVQLLRGSFGGALTLAGSALRPGRHVNPRCGAKSWKKVLGALRHCKSRNGEII
jgi:hypothetical protein